MERDINNSSFSLAATGRGLEEAKRQPECPKQISPLRAIV